MDGSASTGKRALVLLGHANGTYCAAIAKACASRLKESGHDVREAHLDAMTFDAWLHPDEGRNRLEADLVTLQRDMAWAQHWVLVYPTWWWSMPGRTKALFDRVLTEGFAYRFREGSSRWDKLLRGRTADVVVTMDLPPWVYRWVFGSPGHRLIRTMLQFPGIKVRSVRSIGPVKSSTDEQRRRWLDKVSRCTAK